MTGFFLNRLFLTKNNSKAIFQENITINFKMQLKKHYLFLCIFFHILEGKKKSKLVLFSCLGIYSFKIF